MLKTPIHWIFTCKNVDWNELENLYRRAPLGNKKAKELQIAFENSMYTYFLYQNSTLIGAGRALGDGIDVAYLCDIALLPEFQGKGYGKQMLQKLLDATKNHKKIILYSVVGKENFYKSFDFSPMKTAMAIFQDISKAINDGYLKKN